jgi:hypothetical protein
VGTHPRRLVKVGLLTLISALSGVVAAELLRAISGHPLGRFPLELAFLTVAAATSAVITLTVILARWMRNVNEAVQQAARQQTALIAIRPLLGELPLPLGGWPSMPCSPSCWCRR